MTTGIDGTTTTNPRPSAKAAARATAVAKARQVDAANAKVADLSSALATLNDETTAQLAAVDAANQSLAAAQATATAADQAVADAETNLANLEQRVRDQAVRAFMNDKVGAEIAVVVSGDPNQSVRMQSLLADATQTGVDLTTKLQAAHDDLEVEQADARAATDKASNFQRAAAQQLTQLQSDQQAQRQLATTAEARLEHLLSEQEGLGALASTTDLSTQATSDLAKQLRASSTAGRPAGANEPIPSSDASREIALAGNGISVNVSIVDNVKRLLADAAAAGLNLGGGGYRDSAQQIAVRKANCGTTQYAIYQMPASSCSPPTARPGQSMHEKGLAIDFTRNGNLISSHTDPGWAWLKEHADNYGLFNLPAEPWHWSTTGQ